MESACHVRCATCSWEMHLESVRVAPTSFETRDSPYISPPPHRFVHSEYMPVGFHRWSAEAHGFSKHARRRGCLSSPSHAEGPSGWGITPPFGGLMAQKRVLRVANRRKQGKCVGSLNVFSGNESTAPRPHSPLLTPDPHTQSPLHLCNDYTS